MSKETKATKAEFDNRINTVGKLLLQGLSRSEIYEYIINTTSWNIAITTLDVYMRKAFSIISIEATNELHEERGRAVARLNMLFNKSILKGKYREALATQQELNKLLGLYNVNISSVEIGTTEINIEFEDIND